LTLPLKPTSAVEREILDIWCEVSPASAFISGLGDFAGKTFVPSVENLNRVMKRIAAARGSCENDSQRKLLGCLHTGLEIIEPCTFPDNLLGGLFGHLVKEGIKPAHLVSLTQYGGKALNAYLETKAGVDWPIGQRLLAEIRCDGLVEILGVIAGSTASKALKAAVNDLLVTVKKYEKRVHVDGYKNGTFDEVSKIIRERGCALERQGIYAQALRDLYDYHESPQEVEEKGLSFLDNELKEYMTLVQEFADQLGCEAKAETVVQALREKKSLRRNNVIPYINRVRKFLVKIMNRRIVGVNPKYSTKVVRTPAYLSGVLPSGGAFSFNARTVTPKHLFLVTTDPRRNPSTVPSELVNLLVHEEYGHCVHYSNSSKFRCKTHAR
jgi:hypothetical protein